MSTQIKISQDVQEKFPDIKVKMVTIDGVSVKSKAEFVTARRKKILNNIRTKYKQADVKEDPVVQCYRALYPKIGLDPDETPPSVQGLVMKFIKSEQFPSINSVVDCVNLATLESMIPLGVFDMDCVKGEIILRFSKPNEPFMELGKSSPYPLVEGRLVLADNEKVLSVYYWRDSEYQKITERTKNIGVLSCQVEGITDKMIENSLLIAEDILRTSHNLLKL